MQQYLICMMHFMIYWKIVKMLHYNILYCVRKHWTKRIYQSIKMFSRHPARDSSKHYQFVSFDVWVISFFVIKLYSLNFAIEHTQKKVIRLIRIRHTCVALIHKKTVLSLETSSEINIEFIKFVKKKCLPLTKTNREYQIFGNLRVITIFDNFLPFTKSGRPISTLFLPFLDQ